MEASTIRGFIIVMPPSNHDMSSDVFDEAAREYGIERIVIRVSALCQSDRKFQKDYRLSIECTGHADGVLRFQLSDRLSPDSQGSVLPRPGTVVQDVPQRTPPFHTPHRSGLGTIHSGHAVLEGG